MDKALNTVAAWFYKAGYRITSSNLAKMFSNARDTTEIVELFKD